jgi:hypothetical protein
VNNPCTRATLVVGDARLEVSGPSIACIARPSLYREGQMIGMLDFGADSPALFITAPAIQIEEAKS